MVKVYEYRNCSTCRKALKFLDQSKVEYEKYAIVEQPPTMTELRKMLGYLKQNGAGIKALFNTSGVQYRELKIADELKEGLTDDQALKLLADNGKLIKRPFLLTPTAGAVGFDEAIWTSLF
jgi:arsenate reductase